MAAIVFTNGIFVFYLLYILAEQGRNASRNRDFWLSLIGLGVSLYITSFFFPLEPPTLPVLHP